MRDKRIVVRKRTKTTIVLNSYKTPTATNSAASSSTQAAHKLATTTLIYSEINNGSSSTTESYQRLTYSKSSKVSALVVAEIPSLEMHICCFMKRWKNIIGLRRWSWRRSIMSIR